MIIGDLKTVVNKSKLVKNREYIRNLLKEAIQLYVLNFIYTSAFYKELIFTGGTCLRRFYDLPRLSEDLDFDIEKKPFPFEKFEVDLKNYFFKDLQYKELKIKFKKKNKTFFLSFPVLKEIGFSSASKTDILFQERRKPRALPVDEADTNNPAEGGYRAKQSTTGSARGDLFVRLDFAFNESRNFQTEKQLLSTYNFSFLVKAYDFPTLFANKINAFLTRKFRRGKEQRELFKGRDVFDLVWMLQKGKEFSSKPNFERIFDLTGIKDKDKIRDLIKEKVERIESRALYEDLRSFFADLNFVEDFCQNFKQLIADNIDYLH